MRFKLADFEVEMSAEEIQRAIADIVPESPTQHLNRLRNEPETVLLPFGALPLPRVLAQAYVKKESSQG